MKASLLILALALASGPAMASELCEWEGDRAWINATWRDAGFPESLVISANQKMKPASRLALRNEITRHVFAYPRLTPDQEREWVKDYCEEMRN